MKVAIFDFYGVIFNPLTSRPTKGLREFVELLCARAVHCGVASSSTSLQIEAFLQEHSLHDYFSVVIGTDRVKYTKPNPECYLTVAEYFNTKPADCLVIDDSNAALEQAKAVGFQTIYFGPAAFGGLDKFEKIAKLVGP